MKNVSFKLWTTEKCLYKDGYAIWLVVRKDGKRKSFSLGIYAYPHQWDSANEVFVTDRRIANLHPDRKYLNEWLTQRKSEIIQIISNFEKEKKDWTINQFEEKFFNYSKKGKNKIHNDGESNIGTYPQTVSILILLLWYLIY